MQSALPLAARGATLFLNALLALVVARTFGVSPSGEFFLALAAANLVGMIGRWGTESQALKSLPHLFLTGAFHEFWAQLNWLSRVANIGSLAAGGGLATFGVVLYLASDSHTQAAHLVILSLAVPLSSGAILRSAALRATGRTSAGAFAETGLTQGLTILAVLTITRFSNVDALTASFCYLGAAVCTNIVARYWIRQTVPRAAVDIGARTPPDGATSGSLFHMMGSSVLFFALTTSPLFVLGAFASAREVGLYNAAARLSTLISIVPAIQTTSLVPEVARHLSLNNITSANALFKRAARQALGVSAAVALVMLLFSQVLTGIFGPEFVAAVPTLVVLIMGQVLLAGLGNANPIMSITGLERQSVLSAVIAILVGMLPMIFAASVLGSVGVALVLMLVSVGYTIACCVVLNQKAGLRCFVR